MDRPEHVCRGCGCLLHRDDTRCLECNTIRPPRGWRHYSESGDAFLGRVLNSRYLISKHLGSGATAAVYRAESLIIPRRFAIKVIKLNEEQSRMRFEREVTALGQLRNPHVVSFYEIIEVGDQHIALVMDLVEGITLRKYIESEVAIGFGEAVKLGRQIANGMYEAHQRGLIHRDLKPENLMLETMPDGGHFVRILDFGIVFMKGQAQVTQGFIGTPLFCSPEQAIGKPPDERSDIYSLGAILFYMVAGQPPFFAKSAMKVLHEHVATPAPSLFETMHGRLVPDEYEALVASMLAKDPNDRPQTMAEVIEALDRVPLVTSVAETLNEPTLPHPPGCEECGVSKIVKMANRPGSDVACMANIPLNLASDVGHFVASATQSTLAVVDKTKRLRWFSLTLRRETGDPIPLKSEVGAISMAKDRVWVGLQNGHLLALDPDDATEEVREFEFGVRALAVDRHETVVAAATRDAVHLKRADHDWKRHPLKGVNVLATTATGDQIAVAQGHMVTVRRTSEFDNVITAIETPEPVVSLAFSQDGYLLAVALASGQVLLESPDTGREVMELGELGHNVRQVAFSPSNILMALCTDDTNAYILDLQCRHAPECSIHDLQCHRVAE